jgi:DNA polymerase I-like protein with 3'-5' exonuclease and polymerase domains
LLAALKETGARVMATVHDEMVLEAPEPHAQEVAVRLETILTQVGHTYVTRVPIEVEVVIANIWIKE